VVLPFDFEMLFEYMFDLSSDEDTSIPVSEFKAVEIEIDKDGAEQSSMAPTPPPSHIISAEHRIAL